MESERAVTITVIGDAMVRPLLAELDRNTYDLSSLLAVGNGGAPPPPAVRDQLLERFPNLFITDTVGASETGAQMNLASTETGRATMSRRVRTPVSDASRSGRGAGTLRSGLAGLGRGGPLGYLGDPDKTAQTPGIGGVRFSVPGDGAVFDLANGLDPIARVRVRSPSTPEAKRSSLRRSSGPLPATGPLLTSW